ncbi:MAG: penicillin-binding protein 2 [Alphaproteobacteria bacterium]|nr:penicillin-binding protein 2 [Alphaproteobacteria bacterium]
MRPNIDSIGEGTGKTAVEIARLRLMIGGALFAAAFLAIAFRLFDLAVIHQGSAGPQLASRYVTAPDNMARADIVDRNGVLLATNLETASLAAVPRLVHDAERTATALVEILPELDLDETVQKLRSAANFVWLKRGLTPNQYYATNRLGEPGLEFRFEQRRIYPNAALAAHAVGFSGIDNEGLSGIERGLDADLAGGRMPLRLSLDMRVQQIVYQELEAQIEAFSALGGGGLVLDANTGEILAMVSLPDFDPNQPGRASDEQKFNRMSFGLYELGSVFKIFTLATALETGVASLASLYDATDPITVSRFTINDYKPQARTLSLTEVFRYSSNIGAAKIGLDIGGEVQRSYLRNLGLLDPIDIEMPERGAPIYPSYWRDVTTMTVSYGHGIAVTPLHLAAAVATVVNGGTYHPPTLLARDPDEPVASRRVYSQATSIQMRRLLRMVVAEGTGGKAAAPGYLVGGKTGTAEKTRDGGYDQSALLTSFVAAFPITDPKYVVMVMLDEPHGTKASYGYATAGWTAAPVVGRVVARIAPLLGLLPANLPAAPGGELHQIASN